MGFVKNAPKIFRGNQWKNDKLIEAKFNHLSIEKRTKNENTFRTKLDRVETRRTFHLTNVTKYDIFIL